MGRIFLVSDHIYAMMLLLTSEPYRRDGNAEDRICSDDQYLAHGITFKLKRNLWGLAYRYADLLYTSRFPKVLGMFLVGFWAGRHRIFLQIENYLPLIRRVLILGLGFGLIGNLALGVLREIGPDTPPSFLGLLQTVAYAVGVPSLSLFYVAA